MLLDDYEAFPKSSLPFSVLCFAAASDHYKRTVIRKRKNCAGLNRVDLNKSASVDTWTLHTVSLQSSWIGNEIRFSLATGGALIKSATNKAMRGHGHGGMFANCGRYHSC
ncbi:hypothetical protein ACXYN8_06185 [Altererythrobacter sp. CAU 1778]